MDRMKIFVVGAGKLANAILSAQLSTPACEVLAWEPAFVAGNEKALLIHAGSGRQLNECFDYCQRTHSVLIELSTGLETERMTPSFPLIICPNTSMLVLKMMSILRANGRIFATNQITITESHQAAKVTEPGTAYAFAKSLNFPVDEIVSVRDPEIQQREIGIPHDYLGKHAYHKIVIKDGNDQVTIVTKVLGHNSYASGVKQIIDMVMPLELENKRYSILDLFDTHIL